MSDNLFYRFRSVEKLIDDKYKELQNQIIYFASPEDLNDPMEGFRDIFWSGDKIVWKNLFKHYLLCLEQVISIYVISGEEYGKVDEKNIPIYKSYENFPTPQYKEIFDKITVEFFEGCSEIIEKISLRSTPVRKNELLFYLGAIHSNAFKIILNNYEKTGLIPKQVETQKFNDLSHIIKTIDSIEEMIKNKKHENSIDTIMSTFIEMRNDMCLTNNYYKEILERFPNRGFVMIDFPEKYINQIDKITYPKWYAACFMEECCNSSVWGHYGDSHKGICLIFRSDKQNEDFFIKLNGKIGWGDKGAIRGDRTHKFNKINYENGFGAIDFFRSMGRLPIPKLISTWYKSEDNVLSDIAGSVLDNNNKEKWRENYWDNFLKGILVKTKDWEYEKEYRLILYGLLDDEIEEEYRKLKYNFSSLKGLIFGIKTSTEDKLKIVEIIKQKCIENNRNDFEFYQAYYSTKDKNIQHREITFFDIKENNEKTLDHTNNTAVM